MLVWYMPGRNGFKDLLNLSAAAIIALLVCLVSAGFAEDSGTSRPARKPFATSKIEKILESPQREQWQQSNRVLETLALRKGSVVADIGAGSGYFSFRLAEAVGPAGKVYAVDIQEEMLDYIRLKMAAAGVQNILPIRSTATDPRLPKESCDAILLVNTYHELAEPVALMKNLHNVLKPGGKITIINWRKLGKQAQITPDDIIEEMRLAGFRLDQSPDFLERQFFLIFTPV